MCGIAGWLGGLTTDDELVSRVASALDHRGPDGAGQARLGDCTLVHTRLRILDLSDAAAQPFSDPRGLVWTVFNGEIYNHRELRADLGARGIRFRTTCDTEVIPYLYLEHGPGFVDRLRGMFALAVFDTRSRELVLARDRFGIKPLFWALNDRTISFASELGALRLLPDLDLAPDAQAIADYVALHVIPPPQTMFAGIKAIEPGHLAVARLEGGRPTADYRRYHRWTIAPDLSLTLDRAVSDAASSVDLAVRRQLESDVPLGALLSGGIDSSLIVTSAQSAMSSPVRTFTASFQDPEYDESSAAALVAAQLSTEHEVLDFHAQRSSWDEVANLLTAAGQPFADTSLLAVAALSRLVRERVTVALSGDGGDEGFGGYDNYGRINVLAPSYMLPSAARPQVFRAAAALAGAANIKRLPPQLAERLRDAGAARSPEAMLADLNSWSRPRELAALWIGPNVHSVERLFHAKWDHHLPRRASLTERVSALMTESDTRIRMASDFLPKVDIASMRASLEVRVPMLDEDLFAFGLTLPHRLKWHHGSGKRVLRAVARQRLPAVADLPKHGFGVPVDRWVDAAFRSRVREELSPSSRIHDYLNPSATAPLVAAFCTETQVQGLTREGQYQRVFMLLALHLALSQGPMISTRARRSPPPVVRQPNAG